MSDPTLAPDPGAMPDKAGMRPWLRVLLVLSLALNLLVVGAVGGLVVTGGPERHAHSRDSYAETFLRALSPADRRAMFRAMRAEMRAEMRGLMGSEHMGGMRSALAAERRAAHAEILAALRAEPFDAEVLRAGLDRQRALIDARHLAGQRVFVDHVAAMSPADRAAFADRVEKALDARD